MCHLPRENGDLTPPAKARKCPNRSHRTLAASSELQGLSLGWKSDLEDQKARSTARFAALCAASDLCISAPPPALQTRFHFALFQRCSDGLYWLSASWGRNRLPTGRFVRQAEPELVYPEGNAPKLTRPSGSGDLALILPGHRDSGFALNLHRVRRLASTPKAPFLALRRGMGLFPSGKRAAPRLCPRRMDPWGAKSALRLASRWTEAPAH